ncbi:hypothetical protein ACIQU6_43020 [Streptomyces sp. NPDC090442]|uniref:hypothetical protein n=1 Tax=Streptomyces sp. NPDC090442 TaxID=3365962 RepID=UPI003801C9F6
MPASDEMWRRWGEWHKYGARGVKGGEALALEMNRVVHEYGVRLPVTTDRGLKARLKYLNSRAGREEMRAQGITDRALRSWQSGVKPGPANQQRLENAYWARKRENLVRSGWMKRHLENRGMGRMVEIYPVDQAGVIEGRDRWNVQHRRLTVFDHWADAVDAWAERDEDALNDVWYDLIQEIGSDWNAYSYVSAISIGV